MKPIEYYFLSILFLILCIVLFAVSLEISCRYDEWKSNRDKRK